MDGNGGRGALVIKIYDCSVVAPPQPVLSCPSTTKVINSNISYILRKAKTPVSRNTYFPRNKT